MAILRKDHPLNRLRVIIEPGVDPDDTYNETPYEKGYCFVSYLQHLVETWTNLTIFSNLTEGLEFDKWLNTPGWQPYVPDLSAGKELTKPAEQLANFGQEKQTEGVSKQNQEVMIQVTQTYFQMEDISSSSFLDKVLEKASVKVLWKKMVEQYPSISQTHNAEYGIRVNVADLIGCGLMLQHIYLTPTTSYENSLLVQQSGSLALSSMTHVMKSLTPNAKNIFILLTKHQLENKDNSTYIGMSIQDLYQRCREGFLVNSDLTLRAQLVEFKDHKLIKSKKSYDGIEHLMIPIDNATLTEFLEQHETS
ncbi:ORC2 [Mytilus edulis]|uniref:ORC2 n=1 Tax=Mytilus edulis TaxID=6550 RepID=A0A8S3UJL6_MYTED|nr:ORC2 [Mytilus edulis]